jgi:Aerobic-type carbon monoxide dehydrogenase, large subunit CoxL/CutL homologs
VAIDKASGEVAVTRIVVGHDAGMMVNPDGVRHQIHGNVLQSTSRVLKERVTFEESTVSAKEWGAYPILTFPEVPEVDVVMMPRPYDPPLGAGESASVPSAAAIANAVFDATGIRFRELPITSDKLREALNGPDAERQAARPRKEARQMVVRWRGGAVRRGAGHRRQRLAVAGGDRAGGDARRRHLVGHHAGARPPVGRRRRLRGLPYRVGRGDQRRRAGDGDAVRHALQHQHYPGRGNRHRQLVIYRVRSGDAPGHRPRRPPSVSGISLHRLQ